MTELRVVAIPSELAVKVRETMASPRYGHPATASVAKGHGPCRHCLQPFVVGEEVRILFTLNSFEGMEAIPQPGPVFVHQRACERYEEGRGFRRSCWSSERSSMAMATDRCWCGVRWFGTVGRRKCCSGCLKMGRSNM